MDNGLDNMLDMYLFETNTLLEQLDGLLLEAENADEFSTDQINEIFRSMHTIKGSSAMMQFNSVMTVAHRIEDLFYIIRDNGSVDEQYSRGLFNLMFKACDFLKAQIAIIESGGSEEESPDEVVSEIEHFLAVLKGEASADAVTESEIAAAQGSEDLPSLQTTFAVKVFFDPDGGMESLRAMMLMSNINEVCSKDAATVPEKLEANPDITQHIIDNGLIVCFDSEDDMKHGTEVIKQNINVENYEILDAASMSEGSVTEAEEVQEVKIQPVSEAKPESEAPVKKAEAPKKAEDKKAPSDQGKSGKNNLINVNLSKLDALMALVGEIVITQSMVTSSSDLKDLKLDNFTKSARQLAKLTSELQDMVMSVRMVPVAGVFQKMSRIIRDMGQKLDKEVQLVTEGNDTEIDKTIVDNIQDPIMHIVRNSMDHGIETNVADRLAAGKPAKATVTLKAEHTGSEVIITITDDGRGIDPDKILASAKEKGLLTKPESDYTQSEILQLILLPGFSTKEEVTEFSGRGVGMDVVKKNIEKVGGTVYIDSELGVGTKTTFKIPLTLAIIDGMECRVSGYQFTIPIANIRQSFKATEADIIHDAARGEMIQRGEEFITLVRLNKLYNIEGAYENLEDSIVMWVEFADTSYCLLVDELIGQQQIVVKPLPLYLGTFKIRDFGITGCTILGDGNISIILDVPNIYSFATGKVSRSQNNQSVNKEAQDGETDDENSYVAEELTDAEKLKLLTFTIGEKMFAMNTDYVMEILNVYSITPLPLLPDYINGVINLRGQIVPVLDVRLKLKQEQAVDTTSTKSCIVVLDINGSNIGILVDEVFLVADIDKEEIAPPPSNNKHDLITGIVEIENKIHLIFDLVSLIRAS